MDRRSKWEAGFDKSRAVEDAQKNGLIADSDDVRVDIVRRITSGEITLIQAAIGYAAYVGYVATEGEDPMDPPIDWPWEDNAWKPSGDPVWNLVKAGALIAAEIDRLARAKAKESK